MFIFKKISMWALAQVATIKILNDGIYGSSPFVKDEVGSRATAYINFHYL